MAIDLSYLMPILPQLILVVMAIIAPAIGMKSGKAAAFTALGAGFLAIAVTGYMMYDGYTGTFENLYSFNDFSGFLYLIFLSAFCLAVMMSIQSNESRKHHGEYFSLLAAATVGMMMVCAAEELLSLYVGLELASIMSFALVAFKKNDPRSAEAAVKYLITGGLSTALFLYGMSLVYGLTGTLYINDVVYSLASAEMTWPLMVAMVALIGGFAFKISAIPFHAWTPDVYEGAPTPVTAFLAVGSKKMGFVLFFKVFLMMFIAMGVIAGLSGTDPRIHELQWVFAIMAAGTMTLGNVIAVTQKSVKRMLAYSSIAQAGYILIVLAVGSEYALMGGLFHMAVHVFMKGGAFVVVGALCAYGIGENISDYRGVAKRAPRVAFAMMLFLFSLAGIPPLAGFDSKFVLFSSAVTEGGTWIWLVVFAVINSAISLYYYAKVVKAMYVDKGTTTERIKLPLNFKVAIAICAIAVVAIGVYPGPVMDLCAMAASALVDGITSWPWP
jgi:NADH-quinone oxidoreductase subunit N